MNTLVLAAALSVQPAVLADPDLDGLFLGQQQEIAVAMHAGMRADLQRRSADYFAPDGELREILGAALAENTLASR